jgi:hypothetical protein
MAYGSVLTDVVQSSVTGSPPQFNDGTGTQTGTLCRAWVNYKGTATRGINGSFNVSSVTVNGTGDFTFNFTTALADANYSAVGTNSGSTVDGNYSTGIISMTSSAVRMIAFKSGVGNADSTYFCVSVFR